MDARVIFQKLFLLCASIKLTTLFYKVCKSESPIIFLKAARSLVRRGLKIVVQNNCNGNRHKKKADQHDCFEDFLHYFDSFNSTLS